LLKKFNLYEKKRFYDNSDFIYNNQLILFCIWPGENMFVKNNQENKSICMQYCGTCPSFCGEGKNYLFCSRGNVTCKVEQKGCKCGMCPVAIDHKLDGAYFCIHGNLDTLLD
jgi:hypothetical protein